MNEISKKGRLSKEEALENMKEGKGRQIQYKSK